MTAPTGIDRTELPATIRTYLAAHAARDADTALESFRPDAVVVDDGRTYRGTQGIFDFLRGAGSQYDYITILVGWERLDAERWLVQNRLEGDFPGGIADLTYRFTMEGNRIAELEIAA